MWGARRVLYRKYRAKGSKTIPGRMSLGTFAGLSTGSILTYVSFLNAWVPAALEFPDRAIVVSYEALHSCPVHVVDLIANCFLGWRVHCPNVKRAVAENDFGLLKARGLNATDRKSAPTNGAHVQESSKYRAGKTFGSIDELNAGAYKTARRALSGLDPRVRDLFQRSVAPCFVFDAPGANRWCKAKTLATDELVCHLGPAR